MIDISSLWTVHYSPSSKTLHIDNADGAIRSSLRTLANGESVDYHLVAIVEQQRDLDVVLPRLRKLFKIPDANER